jgi:hypothetical protein
MKDKRYRIFDSKREEIKEKERARRASPSRWLGVEDSNLGIRIQSPLSYH